jgi:L-arabinokinase
MEVLRALWRHQPDLQVQVRTSVPRWFLEANLRGPFAHRPCQLDIGAVQADSLSVDAEATLRAYAEIEARKQALITNEVAELVPCRPACIFADIPALAFDIASRLGVPGIATTNFSWDWIYADYVGDSPHYAGLVASLRASYGRATLLLRLPFHGDLSAFPRIRDVPLVVRTATLDRATVCGRLRLPPGDRLVLLSFGGIGVALRTMPAAPAGVTFIMTHGAADRATPPPPCRLVSNDTLRAVGVGHEDLVAACDAVTTKPGYGIVAECIANGTPIIYTSRGRFAEYACLVAASETHLPHAFISNEDLFAGRWRPALESILDQPCRPQPVDTNGAEVAADVLLDYLSGRER